MATNSIDEYVGLRLKIKRGALGITQNELGYMTGITFQQIQKYEKGANRIGSGRLYQFANILSVPINYFFDGYDDNNLASLLSDKKVEYSYENDNVPEKEIANLIKYYIRIIDKKSRVGVLNLIKSLSKNNDSDQ